MALRGFFRFITWPVRIIARPFRGAAGKGAREAAGAASKTGAGSLARAGAGEILEQEYREEPPRGLEAAMFRQLPRPRLTERSASDLTLEQAQSYAEQAARFYDFEFPLFPRGDFFYEEIEDGFLNRALGYHENSIDRRFIDVTSLFRRTLNDNSRQLLLFWTPVIGAIVFGAAIAAVLAGASVLSPQADPWAIFSAAAVAGGFLVFLVYSWPYKVVQQRNLMNLDNYVTSKFARVNNNFQVAKRRALNVERDKRMLERDALRDEAGAWTLSYHWFAMRLFLCEAMLRNKFYQVRRNTALYWAGSVALTVALFATLAAGAMLAGLPAAALPPFAAAAALFVIAAGAVTVRASTMMFNVLQSNEWSRFAMINLDRTIRDHVGEDKLQIVTFRDRNRME